MKEQKHSNISPSPNAPEFQGLLGGRVVGGEITPGGLLLPLGWVGDPGGRQQLGVLRTVLGGQALIQLGWMFSDHLFSAWVLPLNQET